MTYPNRLIDKRVVSRYIAKGMVDQAEYAAMIDGLPDMEHNAVRVLEDESEASAEADEAPDGDAGAPPPASPFG